MVTEIHKEIQTSIQEATSLEQVKEGLLSFLFEEKLHNPDLKIAYVSGIITSDGPEHVERNIERLAWVTNEIRNEYPEYLVFSATDVFTNEVFERINAKDYPYHEWLAFWRKILTQSGISKVFMTPRWINSQGAWDEFKTAIKAGIETTYYIPLQYLPPDRSSQLP